MDSNRKHFYCLGGRHFSRTVNQNVYGKVNPKTQKVVRVIKGICNNCGRNKSQIYTLLNEL